MKYEDGMPNKFLESNDASYSPLFSFPPTVAQPARLMHVVALLSGPDEQKA